ncbi:hypothetical protein PbDSM24746_60200 [Paenibacillus macerans]|nr:hypothetical protein PbDSM24746_60200 [Paenibacillus macerans]GBK72343.1 hypothetical protein PbJCM17693_60510 [Paenibacillus macerans]GIP14142.1 hypothetical protein J1TS5_63120 [Paenibacillus macerans]
MVKNTRYLRGFILLLLLSLFTLIYLSQKESYSKISDIHIEQLKEKESIEILDVKKNNDLDKPFAFVFYKKGYKIGAYTVRVINNKLNYDMDFIINADNNKPVQVFGVRTGFPYLMIQINDDNLLKKGNYIYASFNQKKWHQLNLENLKRSYIISGDYDEASTGRSSVQIYNEKKELIFESR